MLIRGVDYERVDHKIFKYRVIKKNSIQTEITGFNIDHEFFSLDIYGTLTAKFGYQWNGASGPTIDTKSSMRGSLFHDIIFQALLEYMISGYLARWRVFDLGNKLLRDVCVEDKMFKFRANIWHWAVDNFGHKYANLQGDTPEYKFTASATRVKR